ncbi:MAG: hypothetical protein ACOZNI_37125 [Myxococcota bacterium]
MIPLLAMMACNGMPGSIPRTPGAIDAEIAPDLLAVASPDAPYLFWAVASRLVGEQYRSCPKIYIETDGYVMTAKDCFDSAGLLWDGGIAWSIDGTFNTISYNNFRVEGMRGAWVVDGITTLDQAVHANGPAYAMTNKLAVTSFDDPDRTFWIDTVGSVSLWPGTAGFYIGYDEYDGTVGISGWGTAEIEGDRIVSGQANGCMYADHWAGQIEINGANTGLIDFSLVDVTVDPALGEGEGGERPALDSGHGGETGETGETGDSAVDTGEADTGDDGPSGTFPVWPDEEAIRACGQCSALSVDGNRVEGCFDVERSFEYPFFEEFPTD